MTTEQDERAPKDPSSRWPGHPSHKTPLYILLLGSFQKRVAMVVT